MKTKKSGIISVALSFCVLSAANAGSHEALLAPMTAVVLPDDESGLTKVALWYDLSGLEAAEERTAARAAVEWTVPGVSEEGEYTFAAYPIEAAWDAGEVVAGEETLDVGSERAASWAIESRDYDRHGAYAKFLVTDLVDGWVSGSTGNYGILIEMSGVEAEAVTSLSGARLSIRYAVE